MAKKVKQTKKSRAERIRTIHVTEGYDPKKDSLGAILKRALEHKKMLKDRDSSNLLPEVDWKF